MTEEYNKETHKLCTGARACGLVKLRSNFTNDRSKKDGKRNRCKECQREYNKRFADSRRERDKRYRNKPENRFKKYKASALSRGFKFLLTREQFLEFWQKPCTHCGSSIETVGIDRIDSALPYQVGNVESCCTTCNQMKSDRTLSAWYSHMKKISEHTGGFSVFIQPVLKDNK